jgi:SAM-dependent methyltransferase
MAEPLPGRVRCSACRVANTHPWPSPTELDEAYANWYRPSSGRFAGVGDAILRRTRGHLARRIDRIAPQGRVLDVGAGDGALLDALSERGRDCLGLERQSSRPDVRAAEVSELESNGWAAIVFWHSLEHLPEPAKQVRAAAERLQPGGVLAVAVPNLDSLQARMFGERWLALDLPRHLVHLTAKALVGRLQELSLTVERVSYWRGGQVLFGWLHGLVGKLPAHPDLYDAIRRPEARSGHMSGSERVAVLAAASALAPVAALGALLEIAMHRGGTVYVEARRA